MTGFRVSEHRAWRERLTRHQSEGQKQRKTGRNQAPTEDTTFLPQLYQIPALVHNKVFGRLQAHRFLFLPTRLVLVVLATLLILQGVSGNAAPDFQVGEYETVTQGEPIQAYLAPGSTHKYPLEVGIGQGDGIYTFFTQERGVVRLPSLGSDGTAYGLEVAVQHDQRVMDVALMVAKPREGFRSVSVASEEDTLTRFEPGRFEETGDHELLVRSTSGTGPARIMISVVEAPLESSSADTLNWFPLLSGAALATVLAGPYLPGAQGSQPRKPDGGDDASGTAKRPLVWDDAPQEAHGASQQALPDAPAPEKTAYGRLSLEHGHILFDEREGASPEELAKDATRGLVVRNE